MNLRKRAAAPPSILPSAAIQLSQSCPQASEEPLTSANAIGAEPSAIRGDGARRAAGLDSVAGLAGGLGCAAGFGCKAFCCEGGLGWIMDLDWSAGLVAAGTAANDDRLDNTHMISAAPT
ncbi:hypothetical protein [Bradyrhizobium sp. SZCCHNPS1003]|uniref:hypothetical protein n=1 Tax=Bradyrhizobium sp. SZCCHNPS1003 TaxID=3057330 RepID=UPI0028E8AD09|nr:hypothetical protein [Bradyrhizobium sp. SZCCHNPS1003]